MEDQGNGATMQPQSCYIWPGIVMAGCTRGVNSQGIVNGVNYIVEMFDDKHVRLTVHPDFVAPSPPPPPPPATPPPPPKPLC